MLLDNHLPLNRPKSSGFRATSSNAICLYIQRISGKTAGLLDPIMASRKGKTSRKAVTDF
jgi:hypothetical protein